MDDDLDAIEGDVVEEVRLDDLQALVHEGRAVDRDHRAHGPGGVGERVLAGDVGDLFARPAAEGAAGGGDDQLADVGAGAGGECLEEGGVLGVNRDDLAGLGQRLDQGAADDQRLLVGEGEGAAGFEGGEGRREADGAGDAVEDGVARRRGQPRGGVRAGQDLGQVSLGAVEPRQRLAQFGHDVLAGDGDRGDLQPVRLLGEQPDPAAGGGEGRDPEAVGVAQDQVDGLGADGPGGAEDDDVPAAFDRCEEDVGSARGEGRSLMG
ncbi:hypothetical protein QF027_008117 [Streptomyces canus]|nr:hypothetical protein [Streptomyces canus]